MKTFYCTVGLTVLLAVLRMTGVWDLAWGWVFAPVGLPMVGAIGLVVWAKYKIRKQK